MPEVRVQVLYDFEYTTKEGREVWMKEGERLYLIKKTNPDWWQVLRNSERRPFYVPAAYVEEVHPRKTKSSFRNNRLDEVRMEPKPLTKNCRAKDDRYDEMGSAPYSRRLSDTLVGAEDEEVVYDNECFLVSLSHGDITCRGIKEKRASQFRSDRLAEQWEHRSEKSRRAEGHSEETLDHRPTRQVVSATSKKERTVRGGGEGYGRRSDGVMGNSTARLDDSGGLKEDAVEQRQVQVPVPLAFHNFAYDGDFEEAEEVWEDKESSHPEDMTNEPDEVAAHSTSTLLAPTTTLPRLRAPSSPLRTRSSPSTPTLASASAHRPLSPAPSSSPPSSASSSPTSVTTPALFSIPVPSKTITTSSSALLPPPSPSPKQAPVRHLSNGWAEYCDASGRTFFYNGDSGEKSWKPPRRRPRKEETGDGSRSCSSSPLADGEDTSSRALQVPSGWRESYDSSVEQTCYVNVTTGAKWYSSNDTEGRVYYFEENSNESSWTLPEVSVTSPSQTPPPPGISASPMGSDSFISGKSSGGEEVPGANGHEDTEKDGGSAFALRGEPPMTKVKLIQSQWEKASGGRLIQLRDTNVDKDSRGLRASRASKTRSMVLMDPITSEIRVPSSGKTHSVKDWPQLWDGNMCVLREGTLNRTKITENGKKVRKNWAPSHVVLTELLLLFFKDAKTFAAMRAGTLGGNSSGEPAAFPELCVDLNGASVERGEHLSSRRNVFLVSAVLGLQVLCQDDSPQNSEAWFQDIFKAIRQLPSCFDGSPCQNTLERQTFVEAHSPDEHKKFPRIGRSKSVKIKKDASMEDLSAANVTERQVKIRARLKKFFHRRPTMESLVKKGIWKDEPAFGCYLDQVSGEGIPRIPLFVQRCVQAIEAKPENMGADGLYRASGNLSQVQKIRLQVDQYNLDILDAEEDVHVLTGALKLFFRELKEPLIPFSLFNRALAASTNPNRKEQLNEFRNLVKSLPMANHDTLVYLLQHLLRVTKYQDSNRMHIANLAIVFGPTLMWPEQESLNMALDLMQQNLVIECLLQEYDLIFTTGR